MDYRQKLLVSVSGGRSSVLMAWLLKTRFWMIYDIVNVFANTGREKEETLEFMHRADIEFGLNTVWVEAVINPKLRVGTTHKIVTYENACRDGSVFEAVIAKYGIPNKNYPHCTRELKTQPIGSLMRSLGWGQYGKDYITALGYRADEQKRIKPGIAAKNKHKYFLNEMGIKKSDVAQFWAKQSFDLQIPDYEGNCIMCHKKSKRKILTQIVTNPDDLWHEEMEAKYENYQPPGRSEDHRPYRFFREGDSIHDLMDEAALPFELAVDQSRVTAGATFSFDADMDYEDSDCGSSCEPF